MKHVVLLLAFGIYLQAQTFTATFDGFAGSNPPNPVASTPLLDGGVSFDFQPPNSLGGLLLVTDPSASPFAQFGVTAISNGTPYLASSMPQGQKDQVWLKAGW